MLDHFTPTSTERVAHNTTRLVAFAQERNDPPGERTIYVEFDEEMRERQHRNNVLQTGLRRTIGTAEPHLEYQPSAGCAYAQGHLLGAPVDIARLIASAAILPAAFTNLMPQVSGLTK